MPFLSWIRRAAVALGIAATAASLLLPPAASLAADNQASGDVAGNAASLGSSNTVTINSSQLSLVKATFLTDGTPVASGATVARGTPVEFLIYIDNTTNLPVDSLDVQDALAASFAYQPGTIKVSAAASSGSSAATIFAAVNAAAALTDAVSNADVAGLSGGTIGAGSSMGNAAVTVPPNRVWAMVFTVKVQ